MNEINLAMTVCEAHRKDIIDELIGTVKLSKAKILKLYKEKQYNYSVLLIQLQSSNIGEFLVQVVRKTLEIMNINLYDGLRPPNGCIDELMIFPQSNQQFYYVSRELPVIIQKLEEEFQIPIDLLLKNNEPYLSGLDPHTTFGKTRISVLDGYPLNLSYQFSGKEAEIIKLANRFNQLFNNKAMCSGKSSNLDITVIAPRECNLMVVDKYLSSEASRLELTITGKVLRPPVPVESLFDFVSYFFKVDQLSIEDLIY